MIKKLLLTLALVACLGASGWATDLIDEVTYTTPVLTLALAADSSDSAAAIIDTALTKPIYVGNWEAMTLRWVVETDADWDDDTIDVKGQYGYRPTNTGTWIDIPGFSQQILIAGDSTCVLRTTSAVRDSFGVYVRALITHSVTVAGSAAADSAGSSFTWKFTPYFDEVNK